MRRKDKKIFLHTKSIIDKKHTFLTIIITTIEKKSPTRCGDKVKKLRFSFFMLSKITQNYQKFILLLIKTQPQPPSLP